MKKHMCVSTLKVNKHAEKSHTLSNLTENENFFDRDVQKNKGVFLKQTARKKVKFEER